MTTLVARRNLRLNKQEQRFAAWCEERGLIAVFDEHTRLSGEVCVGLERKVDGDIHSRCYQVSLTDYPEIWAHREALLRAEAQTLAHA